MTYDELKKENKQLKKKIKNLKRTKLRLKHILNKTIEELKDKIKTYEINNNWDNIGE